MMSESKSPPRKENKNPVIKTSPPTTSKTTQSNPLHHHSDVLPVEHQPPPHLDSCSAGISSIKQEPFKRKLFPATSPGEDDADKRAPKRRRSTADGGVPMTAAITTPSGSVVNVHVPLSERQQMALLMQMTAEQSQQESKTPQTPQTPASTSAKKGQSALNKKVHKRNERGETQLHIASIRGDAKETRKLIKQGADVNCKDYAGWTPLHEACNHGWFEVAKILLRNGADANALGLDNDTPLHDAVVNNHRQLINLLLRHGANPNLKNTRGKSPMDMAGPVEIIALLNRDIEDLSSSSEAASSVAGDGKSATSPESNSSHQADDLDASDGRTHITSPSSGMQLHSMDFGHGVDGSTFSKRPNIQISVPPHQSKASVAGRLMFKIQSIKKDDADAGKSNPSYKCVAVPSNEYGGISSVTGHRMPLTKGPLDSLAAGGDLRKTFASSLGGGRPGGLHPSLTGSTHLPAELENRVALAPAMNIPVSSVPSAPKHNNSVCLIRPATDTTYEDISDNESGEKPEKRQSLPFGNSNIPALKVGTPVKHRPPISLPNTTSVSRTISSVSHASQSVTNSILHRAATTTTAATTTMMTMTSTTTTTLTTTTPQETNAFTSQPNPTAAALNLQDGQISEPADAIDDSDKILGLSRKVPPLRIIIPPTSKNSSSTTGVEGDTLKQILTKPPLPYVVSTGSTTAEATTDVTVRSPQSIHSGGGLLNENRQESVSNDHTKDAVAEEKATQRITRSRASAQTAETNTATQAKDKDDNKRDAKMKDDKFSIKHQASPGDVSLSMPHRKRKLRPRDTHAPTNQTTTAEMSSAAAIAAAATAAAAANSNDEKPLNGYQLYLEIRKKIREKQNRNMVKVPVNMPPEYKKFLINKKTYILSGNAYSRLCVPTLCPPQAMGGPLRDLFEMQEGQRYELRIAQQIEREKLAMSYEQEVMRVHNKAARAVVNQSVPFSVCSILKDEELYNTIDPEQILKQDEKERSSRSRYNGRQFLQWMKDVDDKYEKLKEGALLRQTNESESLHKIHCMDWEYKLKEIGSCDHAIVVDELHVPIVKVPLLDNFVT